MKQHCTEEDSIVIIALEGDVVGGPDAGILNEKVRDYIDKDKKNIVVDLADVALMNSSGLGTLIGALTTLRKSDGDLVLTNVTERIKNLLEITKLSSVFKTFDSVGNAKAYLLDKA